jgi:hypothetical protein
MTEKHNEHRLDLHMHFTDFKQGFDSTNREGLFGAMDRMGLQQKLIRFIRILRVKPKQE